MNVLHGRAAALGLLLSTTAMPGLVHAEADGATHPADIIVTAQRRDEQLVDVPISLTSVSGESLRARAVPDIESAFTNVPNVDISRTRNSGTEWNVAIRGISNAAALNIDESVAVYVDDVFLSDSSGFNFELYDLASLEVLRGPQGALYGRNAIGGALNIRTVTPGRDTGGRATLLYGSDNEVRAGTAVDLPAQDGRWRTRISGLYARHDGRVKNTFPSERDVDSLNAWGLRGRTAYDLDERTTLEIAADYAKTRRRLGNGEFVTVDEDGVDMRHPIHSRLKNGGASMKLTHEGEGVTLRSITAWRGTKGKTSGSRPEKILNDVADLDIDQHSLTQELQVLSPAEGPVTWLGGVFLQQYRIDRVSSLDNLDFGVGERSLSRIEGRSIGIFGQVRWNFAPSLTLVAGARYTHDRKDLDYNHIGSLAPIFGVNFAPNHTLALRRTWEAPTPEVILEYRPAEAVLLYAKAGRGYKAGGFNTEFVATDGVGFGKESLWNYEAGVKAGFAGGMGFVSAAVFRSNWSNQQVLSYVNGQSHVANAQRSRSQGGEIELTLLPTEGLTLSGGVGYNDAKFIRFANADYFGNPGDGKRQPRAARTTAFAVAQYETPLSESVTGFGRVDYSYRSGFWWDVLNTLREPRRHLLDASLGARFDGTSMRVFVRNLTDSQYHLNAFPGSPGFFEAQGTPGERRQFGISLEQAF